MLTLLPKYNTIEYNQLFQGGSMTNEKLVELLQHLPKFNDIGNTKFSYFVIKNKRLIEQEVKQLEEARKTDPKWLEYNTKRETMAKEYADKDEKGDPIIDKTPYGAKYRITDIKAFEEKYKVLVEENKEIIEAQNKLNSEFETLLGEETKVVLHQIKQSDLPDTLTPRDIEMLEPLIVG